MNSTKTENIGITALINEINQYDNLQENLRKRDKEPVWDGTIELYKNDSNKTTDIVGIIPVQVKGKKATTKSKVEKETYYNVKISDIENYRKTNIGTIYFITEIDSNKNTQIYYKVFDLKTIEQILEENKTKKTNTKRLKFKPLEKNKLVSICIEFINNLKIYKEIKPLKEIEVYNKKTICYNYNTKYELDEIKKSNKVFFETNAYKEAKEKLEKQNIVILHGEPWVGKTSTARKLVSNYVEQGYMFIYGNVDDLLKIKEQVAIDEKIICLLDDFLGSNVQYLEKNIADSTLDKIIGIFKNSKNKKLIFTTRTYIYNNAKELFYKFYKATSIKNEYLIDVANYTYEEKGNILYNHMKINNLLGTDTHKQLVQEEFYVDVITHNNFNPGVIALICEKLKDKQIIDVKDYIIRALNDPDELWEEEYKKLSPYEKIILTIIVLYGVKVPETYVKEQFEQIIKDENITLLDSEIFAKSLHVLSDSFVKITFNEEEKTELEVCKHSIADYVINKIKYREINVERYIKSAKFVETLQYIYLIIGNDNVYEKLAQKSENEFKTLKSFYYNKEVILFNIIKNRINPEREKFLKGIIDKAFIYEDPEIIIDILENKFDVLYEYTKNKFKEDIIEYGNIDLLYNIIDIMDCEVFFKTCVEIFEYQKDTEYMLGNFYIFLEVVSDLISDYVENTTNEDIPGEISEEMLEGEKIEDIIKCRIKDTFLDKIPSLQDLYSKKYINKMLKELYEYCDVYVDKEQLEEIMLKIQNEKKEEKTLRYYKYKTIDKNQVKAIKEKFEKGITINKEKKTNHDYYDLWISVNTYGKWWISSFVIENDENEYNNLKLYKEFIDKKENVDESVKGLAKEFLKYLLSEKFNISQEAYKLLESIAYDSFLNNDFYISKDIMKKYNKKYLKELYNTGVIKKKDGKTKFINKYIHLYLAVNELIAKRRNLLEIIINWIEDEEDKEKMINESLQEVFHLYSEINRKEFNSLYVITALEYFINEIKINYKNIGKMKVSRAIIKSLELTSYFNKAFECIGNVNRTQLFMVFVEFIIGSNIESDLARFDYGIYQKVLYQKCYNKENEEYEINFIEIMKDESLRNVFNKLKIWDYLYDVYLECENALKILLKNKEADVFNIGKKYIEDKYFK